MLAVESLTFLAANTAINMKGITAKVKEEIERLLDAK